MKKPTSIVLSIVLAALSISTGCKPKSSAFPLSLAALGAIHSGHILSYEERDGGIFVSISDSSGDSHIHRLDHSGHTSQEALEILKQKQAELEQSGHQRAAATAQKTGNENWTVLEGDWAVETTTVQNRIHQVDRCLIWRNSRVVFSGFPDGCSI